MNEKANSLSKSLKEEEQEENLAFYYSWNDVKTDIKIIIEKARERIKVKYQSARLRLITQICSWQLKVS